MSNAYREWLQTIKNERKKQMTHTEIIDAVSSINTEMHTNTGNEYMYLTYSTSGWSASVDFLGCRIWDEDLDSRKYNEETDEYEPIETCLRRELQGEIKKMSEVLPSYNECIDQAIENINDLLVEAEVEEPADHGTGYSITGDI